ncbi:MAG: hypothetical protein EZS28_045034, partial [Streblomastix strix]
MGYQEHDIDLLSKLIIVCATYIKRLQVKNYDLRKVIKVSCLIKVNEAMNILSKSIISNPSNCDSIQSLDQLIQSLVKLMMNRCLYFNYTKLMIATSNIRMSSRNILFLIQTFGDAGIQSFLTELCYTGALTANISIWNRFNDTEVWSSLYSITSYVHDLKYGRKIPYIDAQMDLFKLSEEQIECKGGNEEFEPYLMTKQERLYDEAKQIKNITSNQF